MSKNYPSSLSLPITNSQFALRAIELLHREVRESAIFAIGNLSQPEIIVNAMRAGTLEFIKRPTTREGQDFFLTISLVGLAHKLWKALR